MAILIPCFSAKGQENFEELFLTAKELPRKMRMEQDSRRSGPEPDKAFIKYHGEHAGLVVWKGEHNDPIWRVVDIRWVFPSEAEAAAFYKATLKTNSENKPEIAIATTIEIPDFHVFGGTEILRGNLELTHYYYIFRVGRVVAKLYVAQGYLSKEKLKMEKVQKLADKVCERISASLR